MKVVEVVSDKAAVVVVAVGIVTTGSGHGLLCSSTHKLTKTTIQTRLTSLLAVNTRLQPP